MADKNLQKEIETSLLLAGEDILFDLAAELVLKGRTSDKTSSRLITGAEVVLNEEVLEIWMPDYWVYVEYGTDASRVPYSPRKKGQPARGGTSKYIGALLNYLVTKGHNSNDPRTKGIAFAIAAKQKKYGNPIDKSKLGFISSAIAKDQNKWVKEIEDIVGNKFEGVIHSMLDTVEAEIKT